MHNQSIHGGEKFFSNFSALRFLIIQKAFLELPKVPKNEMKYSYEIDMMDNIKAIPGF